MCGFISRSWTTQRFDTSNAIQAKKKIYYDWHPIDQFFLLTIEMFGCLHKQVDVSLHNCANTIWSFKCPKNLLLFVLVICLNKKKSFMLQRMQSSSMGGNNRPNYFPTSTPSGTLPIPMTNLLSIMAIQMEFFWHLGCVDLTSFKLSFFFNLILLYIFQLNSAFINIIL